MKTLILTSQFFKLLLQVLRAIMAHVHLIVRLKHNGTGLPNSMLGASLLVTIYVACSLLNAHLTDQLTANTVLGLGIISGGYVFYLRNQVIALLLLISTITNAMALALHGVFESSAFSHHLLTMIEFTLIVAALLNVIKKETTAI